MRRRGIAKIYLYPTIFIVAVLGLAVARVAFFPITPDPPASQPATQSATAPTTELDEPAKPEKKLADLLDVILHDNPDYPTTQPLDLPADLYDAGKVVVDRPVYIDALGRLWVTHEGGQDVQDVLRRPIRGNTLIVKQHVLHVMYPLTGRPAVFVKSGETTIDRLTDRRSDRFRLDAMADWSAATRFGDQDVVVPTGAGALIYKPGDPGNQNPSLINVWNGNDPAAYARPARVLSTGDRFLTWADQAGSVPVLVEQKGSKQLTVEAGWFEHPLQFILLADGSILGAGKGEEGIRLRLTSLEAPPPKTPQQIEKINAIARELANRDPRIREKSQRELEEMGPGIHPELEAILESLPVEAQMRIENILGQRFAPTLGGLLPLEGEVQTVARFPDGGCVLLLTGGGTVSEDGEDRSIIPAWIAIRPGHYIERLPDKMVEGFAPGKYKFFSQGSEWVQFDPVLGPRRWMGSRYETLLPKSLRHFDTFVGIDGNKRWVFRSTKEAGKTLIIDPSLPDITPRLPVWAIDAPDGAGWTDGDLPAIQRGKQVFVLGESGWRLLNEATEKFVDTSPAILPTNAITPDGTRLELAGNAVTAGGSTIIHDAKGATSIFFVEGRIFLTAPGEVHRFSLAGKLDRTFTKALPAADPKRTWVDQHGRLVMAGESGLWVAFPTGRVPRPLASLMIQQPVNDDEE